MTNDELRAILMLVASFAAVWALAVMAVRPYQWLARARHFLNVLDSSRIRGVAPESVLVKLADMNATEMGLRLHLLAYWLRQGLNLAEALPRVRRFLPRSVETLVVYGYTNGRLPELLPVAQQEMRELSERPGNHRQDLFSLLGMAFGVFFMGSILFVFVLPKFEAIMIDMGGRVPMLLTQMTAHTQAFLQIHLAVVVLMVVAYRFLLAGPAGRTWMECKRPLVAEQIQGFFSFQRMLYQQRFGRTLARLLDTGVAEDEALIVAGMTSGSCWFRARIERAVAALRGGAGLVEALRKVDLDEDFFFRLKAARDSGHSLSEALEDWLAAVRARAEFRERVVVDLVGTFFIFYNAVLIGAVGYCFFHFEIQIINALTVW